MVLLFIAVLHSDNQHRFRSSTSNANLLTFIAGRVCLYIDENGDGRDIDLGVSKAFDKFYYLGLLHQLKRYGVAEKISLIWFSLSNQIANWKLSWTATLLDHFTLIHVSLWFYLLNIHWRHHRCHTYSVYMPMPSIPVKTLTGRLDKIKFTVDHKNYLKCVAEWGQE